jgi:hypothetical protein
MALGPVAGRRVMRLLESKTSSPRSPEPIAALVAESRAVTTASAAADAEHDEPPTDPACVPEFCSIGAVSRGSPTIRLDRQIEALPQINGNSGAAAASRERNPVSIFAS